MTRDNKETPMMNQDLLIALVKALARPDDTDTKPAAGPTPLGWRIVALERAWVWVGDCYDAGDMIQIKNAINIRRWGTTRGIGELVAGPTSKTVQDMGGDIDAPKRAVIFLLKTEGEKWRR